MIAMLWIDCRCHGEDQGTKYEVSILLHGCVAEIKGLDYSFSDDAPKGGDYMLGLVCCGQNVIHQQHLQYEMPVRVSRLNVSSSVKFLCQRR